jgi:hypothetical protein
MTIAIHARKCLRVHLATAVRMIEETQLPDESRIRGVRIRVRTIEISAEREY